MARRSLLIPEITTETKSWTTRIIVTEDIPALSCGRNSRMKRYILTDQEGNEVAATVWDFHIPFLVKKLHLFKVYDITNAQVKLVEEKFRVLKNPYQWVLQRDTLIIPRPEVEPNLSCFLSNLTSFNEVAKNAANLKNIDIMGVLLAYANPTTVITDEGYKNIQRFTFVNMERIPITVTLWGEMQEIMRPILEEAADTLSVVVAKRLSPSKSRSNYKLIGPSVSSKNSSSFTINPPLEAASELKSWIDSKTHEELEELLIDQTIPVARNKVTEGSEKVLTLAEIETEEQNGDYWIKGLLQIAAEEQTLYYIGCNKCSAKISADEEGVEYECYNCGIKTTAVPRSLVLMMVADESMMVEVVAINKVAERILQTTSSDIFRLSQMEQSYDLQSLNSEFEGKTFLMLLRRTSNQQNDHKKKLVLVDYFESSDVAADTNSSNQGASASEKGKASQIIHSPLSPLKRQLSEITLSADMSTSTLKKKLIMPQNDNPSQSSKPDESSSSKL